ncbi:hypothetical protein Godav_025325 [Gossypium davidsonii]|uniref:Uncharacterized protein n=2 Tax=Gossypium TaxID=3633 RepID=A0A7J8TCN3_GOSDV|nr:hypothetical protein [Gossypium davidsonii]MBA0649991.1 hypothetical protein [Gossypium klotzschianum]
MAVVEEILVDLSIGEEEVVAIALGLGEPGGGVSYEYCFVGIFLTSNVINFPSMKATLANVWHLGAIRITAHLDIRRPLKRKKKAIGESFYPIQVLHDKQELEFRRDISPRASTRRAVVSTSIWLREEDDSRVLVFTARNPEIVRIREKMSNLLPLNFGANWNDGQVGGSIKLGKSDWTLSVGLSSGASNGSIGGIIRSYRIGPLGMDLDEEISTVGVHTPIMHIEGLKRSQIQSKELGECGFLVSMDANSSLSTGLDQQASRSP